MHGSPWLRLLRREVETLVRTTQGDRYLRQRQAQAELAGVNRELKRLRAQLAELDQRRSTLTAQLKGGTRAERLTCGSPDDPN